MINKKKALWIEDEALKDLPYLIAPVFMDGRYDLVIAKNATEAVSKMRSDNFDVIIFDIRILPGEDKYWIEKYNRAGESKITARLGLDLIKSVLQKPRGNYFDSRLDWIQASIIGVLTVEEKRDIQNDLMGLGISDDLIIQKTAELPDTILLSLIELVLKNNSQ